MEEDCFHACPEFFSVAHWASDSFILCKTEGLQTLKACIFIVITVGVFFPFLFFFVAKPNEGKKNDFFNLSFSPEPIMSNYYPLFPNF